MQQLIEARSKEKTCPGGVIPTGLICGKKALIYRPHRQDPQLGWEPKTKFAALVKLMVEAVMELLCKRRHGEIKVSA
jgi:hypothetical protein